MANYCATCGVKYTAREHYCLEKKICRSCHQEMPIAAFPVHPSSLDGHKHTCTVCYEAEKKQTQPRHIGYSVQPYQAQETQDCGTQLHIHKPGHKSTLWAKKLLALPNMVVLDTETTGLGVDDEIIEIAIVDGTGRKRLDILMQCERVTIPQEAKAIHHINESMLKNAHKFPQIWDRLMRFLETREIVIYNAAFDMRMLRQTAQRYQLPMPAFRVHCLMEQYSAYVGEPSGSGTGYRRQSQAAACAHFQIDQPNAHRALPDAQTSLCILQKLAALADASSEAYLNQDIVAIPPETLSRTAGDTTAISARREGTLRHSGGSKKQQAREERRAVREKQNLLLRTYGYRWKRTEELTDDQRRSVHDMMLQEEQSDAPQWALLSPLEMPVDVTTILHWLGERGIRDEDVHVFLQEHGFTVLGKDEHHHWRIQSPGGEYIELKQAWKAIEQKRLDDVAERHRVWEQKMQERFEQSIVSLKKALDLFGEATNQESAWGYSPYPFAKRLADGSIQVRTYHFESEWRTTIYQTEADVVNHLYLDGDGRWDPGEWTQSL